MSLKHAGIGMTSQRTRTRMIERLREQGITDEVVLAAMTAVPRHIFVDEALASRAYEDIALPLGYGQTISSPYIVARMTQLARGAGQPDKVLEIGAGCGYQTAILANVAKEVFSVERLAALLPKARARLRELKISNVRMKHGDGNLGLPEAAPFDVILIAAALTHVPPALLEQIAPAGRMIFPKGNTEQHLCVIERNAEGQKETLLEAVKFVPMLMGAA